MHICYAASYKDIDHVLKDSWNAMANLIHEALEYLGSFVKSVRHSLVFEKSKWCDNNSYFKSIIKVHWYLIKGPYKVDLGRDSSTTQQCPKVLDMRNRAAIRCEATSFNKQ